MVVNLVILSAALLSLAVYPAEPQQSQGDPKLTEVWEPVPRVVTPGVGAAAPSDAIVLFDGKDLSEWQHADRSTAKWSIAEGAFTVAKGAIFFRAPRFAENGNVLTPAYLTVVHNGVLVQDHAEIKGSTVFIGSPSYQRHNPKEPLVLQDHANPVSYRNVWIREL
ncbi:MAG: DUF1080 domain-containing protein [Acidobacteria bacterium]|nr:DUF1080 domain-containing protein [Acidobacteriota bacterium]